MHTPPETTASDVITYQGQPLILMSQIEGIYVDDHIDKDMNPAKNRYVIGFCTKAGRELRWVFMDRDTRNRVAVKLAEPYYFNAHVVTA